MKVCKYCGSQMQGEFETIGANSHRYKAFYTCINCGALCDGEYTARRDGVEIISEHWWNPNTKQFEK